MSNWIFNKITAYLTQREGYTAEPVETDGDTVRTVMQDSFGFRYEVRVKSLGRIHGTSFGDDSLKTGSYMSSKGYLDV